MLVTHHVDDIPTTITHALLLREGRTLRSGDITATLDEGALSECFGLPLRMERRPDGRYQAWAR